MVKGAVCNRTPAINCKCMLLHQWECGWLLLILQARMNSNNSAGVRDTWCSLQPNLIHSAVGHSVAFCNSQLRQEMKRSTYTRPGLTDKTISWLCFQTITLLPGLYVKELKIRQFLYYITTCPVYTLNKSRGRAVGIATGYRLNDWGFRVPSSGRGNNFHFSVSCRQALGFRVG
jgi:hypothetical protein